MALLADVYCCPDHPYLYSSIEWSFQGCVYSQCSAVTCHMLSGSCNVLLPGMFLVFQGLFLFSKALPVGFRVEVHVP